MRPLSLSLSLSLALSLSLGGCSIFNRPDPGHLDANSRDGGTDAHEDDAYVNDAGSDAGMGTDAFVCPNMRELVCNDGHDDDCDGLTDCADPDCVIAAATACCMAGGAMHYVESFDKSGAVWTTAGNWVAPASMASAITATGVLLDMGTSAPIGMVNDACLHVDLGTEIRFTMRASPCTGATCDGRMEVVIGPSTMFMGMLTDDLAIRGVADATRGLRIDILQGGTVRASSTLALGVLETSVVVNLSPGVAEGAPAIVGTVVVSQGALSETLVPLIRVTHRDVFGTSSCHGLHLGVQGVGNHVGLDNIQITQLDCANPGRFDSLGHDAAELDAVTMSVSSSDMTTGWGRGGIGDPALFEGTFSGRPTERRFTLLFDGSPVDRSTDVIGHLPLSIGGADTLATSGADLVLVHDCGQWVPRGSAIACTAPAAATGHALIESPRVMRDPTLYPQGRDAANIDSFRIAWVGEGATGSELHLFTTVLTTGVGSRILGVPIQTDIVGEDATTCPSIRNPLLLPLLGSTDWLVFYVCDTFPPVVHVARMDGGGNTAMRVDVAINPGPLAADGITDIAGVVFDYVAAGVHTPTYRLWLTAHPTTARSAVLYFEGTPPPGALAGSLPVFVPFAGNPVLTETSTVFGSCARGCQLHGITATRLSDQPTRVRLLIERWVDTGSGLTYGLVPLEQIWPRDG